MDKMHKLKNYLLKRISYLKFTKSQRRKYGNS